MEAREDLLNTEDIDELIIRFKALKTPQKRKLDEYLKGVEPFFALKKDDPNSVFHFSPTQSSFLSPDRSLMKPIPAPDAGHHHLPRNPLPAN